MISFRQITALESVFANKGSSLSLATVTALSPMTIALKRVYCTFSRTSVKIWCLFSLESSLNHLLLSFKSWLRAVQIQRGMRSLYAGQIWPWLVNGKLLGSLWASGAPTSLLFDRVKKSLELANCMASRALFRLDYTIEASIIALFQHGWQLYSI